MVRWRCSRRWPRETSSPQAQARGGAPPQDSEASINAATSPAELQRLFDAYVLVQAQDVLQLTDAQLPDFMSRLRALQEVRRRESR